MEVMHVSWQQCESAVYEDVAGICVAGAALWDQCCSFAWQALGFGSMMAVLHVSCMARPRNTPILLIGAYIRVAGAALWDQCCSFAWQALGFGSMMVVLRGPAMQLTCNTHATHSQHDTQHEDFPCKFSIKMPVSRG